MSNQAQPEQALTYREVGLLLGTLDSVIKFHLMGERENELIHIRDKLNAQNEIQPIRTDS